jgi:hypothetical protein
LTKRTVGDFSETGAGVEFYFFTFSQKKLAVLIQISAVWAEKRIIALVLTNSAIFSRNLVKKSPKTLTPGCLCNCLPFDIG